MADKPRAYTAKEVRDIVLDCIRAKLDYWVETDLKPDFDRTDPRFLPELRYRMEGLVHSILVMFDGNSGLPPFDIVMQPHPSDQKYREENDENWFEPGTNISEESLHDLWYRPETREK